MAKGSSPQPTPGWQALPFPRLCFDGYTRWTLAVGGRGGFTWVRYHQLKSLDLFASSGQDHFLPFHHLHHHHHHVKSNFKGLDTIQPPILPFFVFSVTSGNEELMNSDVWSFYRRFHSETSPLLEAHSCLFFHTKLLQFFLQNPSYRSVARCRELKGSSEGLSFHKLIEVNREY